MTTEALVKLTDEELYRFIDQAKTELTERAEKRRRDALEEIYRRAKEVGLHVTVNGKKAARNNKAPLKPGGRYTNPDDAKQSYIVGNGRPPAWFAALRGRGKLPEPANDNQHTDKAGQPISKSEGTKNGTR